MRQRNRNRHTAVAVLTALLAACAGEQPDGLGLRDGRLAPCKPSPNCVADQTDVAAKPARAWAPLALRSDPAPGWDATVAIVRAGPRVHIVVDRPGYLHAEYASRVFGFVDDVELALDPVAKVVHVRSASRLGYGDFGVNRARIEDLRARAAAAGV